MSQTFASWNLIRDFYAKPTLRRVRDLQVMGEADTGASAVALIEAVRPDLVLLVSLDHVHEVYQADNATARLRLSCGAEVPAPAEALDLRQVGDIREQHISEWLRHLKRCSLQRR